jgi:hypothetical protein
MEARFGPLNPIFWPKPETTSPTKDSTITCGCDVDHCLV